MLTFVIIHVVAICNAMAIISLGLREAEKDGGPTPNKRAIRSLALFSVVCPYIIVMWFVCAFVIELVKGRR